METIMELFNVELDDIEIFRRFVLKNPDLFDLFDDGDIENITRYGDTWDGTALLTAKNIAEERLSYLKKNKKVTLTRCPYCKLLYRQTMSDDVVLDARRFGVIFNGKEATCADCFQNRGFLSNGTEDQTYWIIDKNGDGNIEIFDGRER